MGRVRTLWGTPVDVRRPPEPIAPGNNMVEYRIRFLDGIDSHRCGEVVPQPQGKVVLWISLGVLSKFVRIRPSYPV